MKTEDFVESIVKILDEKKATDIVAIDVEKKTTLAEYFIIASGSSVVQVKALSDELIYQLKQKHQLKASRVEGQEGGRWILLDFAHVVVHLFHEEERGFYKLDRLWSLQEGPASETPRS